MTLQIQWGPRHGHSVASVRALHKRDALGPALCHLCLSNMHVCMSRCSAKSGRGGMHGPRDQQHAQVFNLRTSSRIPGTTSNDSRLQLPEGAGTSGMHAVSMQSCAVLCMQLAWQCRII